jgi:membrane-associated phospholipid phosphatase
MSEIFITFAASYLIWLMFLGLFILWVVDGRIKKEQVLHALLASIIAWIVAHIIKNLFPTVRPFIADGGPVLTATIHNDSAFPSGHAALAFALATALWLHDRKIGLIYLLLAVVVGMARVFGNVHYPLDIVGGAVLGILSALILQRAHLFKLLKQKSNRIFLFLVPILILLAVGVFVTTSKRAIVPLGCTAYDLSGEFQENESLAIYEGEKIRVPALSKIEEKNIVLGVADPSERWIEVDLSDQILRAWDGDNLFLETPVSTGLPWWPTPEGEFRIWIKLRFTKMEGGEGRYYYNLPNVPYTMFFESKDVPGYKGYGLHGTYWHNDFGTQRSHGCVNLPTSIAKRLFYWTTPVIGDGKWVARATSDNPGTRVVIHK